jgi:hypothetical protein
MDHVTVDEEHMRLVVSWGGAVPINGNGDGFNVAEDKVSFTMTKANVSALLS